MNMDLTKAAELALDHANSLGMDQSEVALHKGTGTAVTARQRELETVEKHNDAQLVVSVFKDHKTGSASSADLSEQGIRDSVNAAVSIAKFTGADECFGLASQDLMAEREIDLDLYHPWDLDVSAMAEIALNCERAALEFDERITNSEGATANSYCGSEVYANSHGFLSEKKASQHSISCSVIGTSESGMQRDYWYDSNRNPAKLESESRIGERAAERTVRRLSSRKISSCECPVLFDSSVAKSLIGHLVGAIKGGAIYKKASFMLDKVDQGIMPEFVNIYENPHKLGGATSAWHDGEGVSTPSKCSIVESGCLQRYVLGSYTARKLGLETTANAGGVRNLTVSDTKQTLEDMLQTLGTGLFVTELIGSGINSVTGDYSRGAAGFWIEHGEIQYPVAEITIAGNLLNMFQHIAAIGNDIDSRGNTECGSILIESMTLAGS